MFCKNCGRQIPDNAAFCPACGTKRSGGDTFGETKTGRDIKNLPSYAKESDLNRSGDAIDSDRVKFNLSDSGQKKFSLSDSGQKKFSLSGGDKKFSLSDKNKDSGDGIVRISANREPTGFVNPLKDSGKTVFRDEPAAKTEKAEPQSAAPEQEAHIAPEQAAGGETEEKTGFVNPLKGSDQNIHWGSDGDRNAQNGGKPPIDPGTINSHMGFAIFCTLCCCLPTGIAAIVFASQVSKHLKDGNYEQAQKSADNAQLLCWISVGLYFLSSGIGAVFSSLGQILGATP